MNRSILLFVSLFVITICKAQAPISKWPDLKNFHEVISKTFHPSQEGHMEPIKQNSALLYEKSKLLATNKIPAEFDKPEVKKATKDLLATCKKVNDLVKSKGAEADIKKELVAAHDQFHKILELAKIEE